MLQVRMSAPLLTQGIYRTSQDHFGLPLGSCISLAHPGFSGRQARGQNRSGFSRAVLSTTAVRLHGRLRRKHYRQPSEFHHGMRRMVQFLNPQDWLNAQVRGPTLAALAWASLQGAGFSFCFTLTSGVGGGFRWNLPHYGGSYG